MWNYLQNQIVGSDDRNNWNDLISNFCSVIIVSALAMPENSSLISVRASRENWAKAFNHSLSAS